MPGTIHCTMEHSNAMDDLEPATKSVRFYPHHIGDIALHKYLLLYEQHEFLLQHLNELRPLRQASLCTPVSPNPAELPTRRVSCSADAPVIPRRRAHRNSGGDLSLRSGKSTYRTAIHGDNDNHELSLEEEVALEEAKLCDVNEGMKRALTELLNCETVRADAAFRTWVQSRLMDTERELRSGRRRRSAPS
ncbi:hypothetical protein VTJ04DRAFT_8388 [Mycothermus thermophilus]|uniref:uncharacterized protein n=1 Tax=Humicola insolens TaxID=85995 RepID=UPI003744869A